MKDKLFCCRGLSGDVMKRQTATVECPKSMVGRVIGKNGETIKSLQSYTGALIQIDQTVEPTKVTISGNAHSLSLAVSMVTDIVKGTFKGFALLRQVTTPGVRPVALPPALAQPRPVYAPGYGLIPPSQLYGADERAAAPGFPVDRSQEQLQQTFTWGNSQLTPSQVILGLQPVSSRNPQQAPSALTSSQLQQVPVQQGLSTVYGTMAAPYGATMYSYPTQDFTQGSFQAHDAYVFQDPSMFPGASGLPGDSMRVGAGAKLLQAAGAKASRQINWVPKVPSGANVNELLTNTGNNVSPGNLVQVVDSEGKIYYYNPDG